jgi:hypothetical protein
MVAAVDLIVRRLREFQRFRAGGLLDGDLLGPRPWSGWG